MRGRNASRRASAILETALWVPLLVSLLFATVELARVSYTYYTLHKILYTVASYLSTQPGVNFCDDADATIDAAKNLALFGGIDADANQPIIQGLAADQITVRVERFDAESDSLAECECSETGCDINTGGIAPNYIVVAIPDGFQIRLALPGINNDPIPLRPRIRMPYGGG
ncbi:MAG: pilus assembly protein [Bryobacteraceae bacterium]